MKNRRNIVSIGFNVDDLLFRFNLKDYRKESKYYRFPKIVYLDSLDDLNRQEGFALIINIDVIKDLYYELDFCYTVNDYNRDILYEFDRLYRKKFSNFEYVIIYSIDGLFINYNYKNIHSNIMFIDEDLNNKLDIFELYENYSKRKYVKVSRIKKENIDKLKHYVDNKKDYFSSIDIINKFKVSPKWVKRYMYDMNKIYNNIGYNYCRKMWYKVK